MLVRTRTWVPEKDTLPPWTQRTTKRSHLRRRLAALLLQRVGRVLLELGRKLLTGLVGGGKWEGKEGRAIFSGFSGGRWFEIFSICSF